MKQKGGKFYARNHIYPYFPKQINDYIEPFVGGGSVFLGLESAGIHVKTGCYLNDLDDDITKVWKVFWEKRNLDQLTQFLSKYALYSQSIFEYIQKYQPKTEIEACFKIIMLTLLSYQGECDSYYIGIGDINRKMNKIYKPEEFWNEYHNYLVRMNVKISQKDFAVFFQGLFNRKESFIYADPPYFETSGYENLPFPLEKHELLCKLIHEFKGKVVLSYDQCAWVKDHYSDMKLIDLETRWTGNIKSEKSKHIKEYLILNYDPDIHINIIKVEEKQKKMNNSVKITHWSEKITSKL